MVRRPATMLGKVAPAKLPLAHAYAFVPKEAADLKWVEGAVEKPMGRRPRPTITIPRPADRIVDMGVVYFAPRYALGTSGGVTLDAGTLAFPSGVYAFDGAAGTKKWSVVTSPASGISAGNGMVYLVEGGPSLVARKETDGSAAWSAPLGDAGAELVGSSAPVLAQGLVIVATVDQVLAFDATKGTPAWSAAVQGAGQHAYDQATVNFVSCPSAGEPIAQPAPTTLAAATASGTLVVTAATGIEVLSLGTGTLLGTYPLAGAVDPVLVGNMLYVLASAPTGRAVVALRSE